MRYRGIFICAAAVYLIDDQMVIQDNHFNHRFRCSAYHRSRFPVARHFYRNDFSFLRIGQRIALLYCPFNRHAIRFPLVRQLTRIIRIRHNRFYCASYPCKSLNVYRSCQCICLNCFLEQRIIADAHVNGRTVIRPLICD